MAGRYTKTGYFSLDWAEGVKTTIPMWVFSLSLLCRESDTRDNQVLHADVTGTGTNITFTSPPPLCSPSPLPLSLFPYTDFFPSLFLSLSISLCTLCSILLRLAKFRKVPRGPDGHLGRSCVVCVPGHRGAQT